ncbi:MAG TPA: c-type cytochrome domain-containing protein, partial [Bryobacteraceae bacterium]|nr:c-type cytochrome domain-containing protein [Bryobacteraceae bacterium]
MILSRCLFVTALALPLGAQSVDFAKQIQPVLNASCVPCHHGDKAPAGLQLDSPAAIARAVKAGDPAASTLYVRITAKDDAVRMPPAGMPRLTVDKVAVIRGWIEQGAPGLPAAAAPVDFARDVQPIFAANCYACHKGPNAPAGLHLDQRATAMKEISPGNSAGSRIIHRVLGQGNEPRMPFGRTPLSDAQIATLRRWIDEGAHWPDALAGEPAAKHWAYVKPVRPPVPGVHNQKWVRNPIDAFVLARLEKEGLSPSHEASRETLIRRLSLDLVGLPPSPAEIDE